MFKWIWLCICLFLFSSVYSQPKITHYVTDETGTLSSSQLSSLESKLSQFEKETSTQVVVYMINSLEGESLEEKSYEIAEKNGIGQKGKNNGALVFIAMSDRKLRIEVGYGLEGALPDALCNQIIRKEITPYFKQGKYYEGINAGVDAIIKATKGEYTQEKESSKDKKGIGIGICGLPLLFFIIIFFFGIFFVISIFRRIFGWNRLGRGRNWWYTGGSGSSWGSGSSGSSFSGFSGGGGSFGGGGASGSW
jgi:uncharacterized protein